MWLKCCELIFGLKFGDDIFCDSNTSDGSNSGSSNSSDNSDSSYSD